jgi:hypothetical protein
MLSCTCFEGGSPGRHLLLASTFLGVDAQLRSDADFFYSYALRACQVSDHARRI